MNFIEKIKYKHKLKNAVKGLSLEDRQRAYNTANCWRWPEPLVEFKPEHFDSLPNYKPEPSKFSDTSYCIMFDAVKSALSPFEASQGWWVYELDRTKEEHEKWWKDNRVFMTLNYKL